MLDRAVTISNLNVRNDLKFSSSCGKYGELDEELRLASIPRRQINREVIGKGKVWGRGKGVNLPARPKTLYLGSKSFFRLEKAHMRKIALGPTDFDHWARNQI